MPQRITQVEFRDQLRFSKYPFSDKATLLSESGFLFPEPLIADMSVYMVGGRERAWLTQVVVEPRKITFFVGDEDELQRISASYDPLNAPESIQFEDSFGRPAGMAVIDPVIAGTLSSWGAGEHDFPQEATEIVASAVIPLPEVGVRGFITPDGDILTGHVPLVGKDGVVLRYDEGFIRVDIVGDPLFARKVCGDFVQTFENPIFLRTINGIGPDEYGQFHLTLGEPSQDEALRIQPIGSDTLAIRLMGATLPE